MGFPVGYTEVFLPTLLLHSLSLLGLLRSLILSLLDSLGLSCFLQPHPAHPDHPPRPPPPLPAALLIRERLPVTPFSDSLIDSPGGAAERCAVCLSEFEGGEEVRRPLNCRHIFHRGCLDRWIDHDHRTCPLCRAHLLSADLMDDFHQRLLAADHDPPLVFYPDYALDFDEHESLHPWPSHLVST